MKCITCIYGVICFMGMMYQLYLIICQYLEYGVVTHLSIDFDDMFKIPDMSVCIDYYDIMDLDAFNKIHEMDYTRNTSDPESQEIQLDNIQMTATISDVLNLTPGTNETIKSCSIRLDFWDAVIFNTTSCYNRFDVTKYSFMDSICYKIHLNQDDPNRKYIKQIYYFSPSHQGMLWRIVFGHMFHTTQRFKIMVHPSTVLPFVEATSDPYQFRVYDTVMNRSIYSNYLVSANRFETTRLKPPYITDCRDYVRDGYQDSYGCRESCILDKITQRKLNRIPFAVRTTHNYNWTRINRFDTFDASMMTQMNRDYIACYAKCHREDCFSESYRVTVTANPYDHFQVTYMTPTSISIQIMYSAFMNPIDFFTYIMSALGTWLGISVMGLNPVGLSLQFKEKLHEKKEAVLKLMAIMKWREYHHDNLSNDLNVTTPKVINGADGQQSKPSHRLKKCDIMCSCLNSQKKRRELIADVTRSVLTRLIVLNQVNTAMMGRRVGDMPDTRVQSFSSRNGSRISEWMNN